MVRRLTALLTSLVLVPSMLLAGGPGCGMGEREAPAEHHGAHHADAHAPSHAVADQPDPDAPVGHPHAPTECTAVTPCGVAVVVAETVQLDTPPHATDRVAADAALVPDSPALGLEPPPPRG